MKHNLSITFILLALFVVTQVVGLAFIGVSSNVAPNDAGELEVTYETTSIGERPDVEGAGSFIYLLVGIVIGTVLILLLAKFGNFKLWKVWFFFAVFLTISIALGVFLRQFSALAIALLLAIIKVWKPNVFFHNLTEILMYAGLAVFLVPLFNILWATILLVAISIYDVYAVWKSKHMVTLAKFTAESQLFAGLHIPYITTKDNKTVIVGIPKQESSDKNTKNKTSKKSKLKINKALLGGGDLTFPLIYAGVYMNYIMTLGVSKMVAFQNSLIISLFSAIALFLLFKLGTKDKFYPAMPFISAGCFIGLGIAYLLTMI